MHSGGLGRFESLLTAITAKLHVRDVTLDVSLRVLLAVGHLPALGAAPLPVQLPDDLTDLLLDLSEGEAQDTDVLQLETFLLSTFLSLSFPFISLGDIEKIF